MPASAPTEGAQRDAERRPLVIWRFSDGKAGHDNQSLGLAQALAEATAAEVHTLTPLKPLKASLCLISGRGFTRQAAPRPDLILGAGHATHLSLLAARRARGGRAVVLMTPTLPKRWFDLCLIPEHDRPDDSAHVVITRGALNRVRAGGERTISAGLILVGGPSAHFLFEPQKVTAQIHSIVGKDQYVQWTAATSRRTPEDFAQRLRSLNAPNLNVVPVEETTPDWLTAEIGRTKTVWVTEDSASMVFEALTGGAAVGLLSLERSRPGRVSRGIEQLVNEGKVTRFEDWLQGAALEAPDNSLDEAGRCARLILERWPELKRHA